MKQVVKPLSSSGNFDSCIVQNSDLEGLRLRLKVMIKAQPLPKGLKPISQRAEEQCRLVAGLKRLSCADLRGHCSSAGLECKTKGSCILPLTHWMFPEASQCTQV